MSASKIKPDYNVASRLQRLDRRQECRFMLAIIMLIGVATASVLATTQQALSQQTPSEPPQTMMIGLR
jgi:hypothetical protein